LEQPELMHLGDFVRCLLFAVAGLRACPAPLPAFTGWPLCRWPEAESASHCANGLIFLCGWTSSGADILRRNIGGVESWLRWVLLGGHKFAGRTKEGFRGIHELRRGLWGRC